MKSMSVSLVVSGEFYTTPNTSYSVSHMYRAYMQKNRGGFFLFCMCFTIILFYAEFFSRLT